MKTTLVVLGWVLSFQRWWNSSPMHEYGCMCRCTSHSWMQIHVPYQQNTYRQSKLLKFDSQMISFRHCIRPSLSTKNIMQAIYVTLKLLVAILKPLRGNRWLWSGSANLQPHPTTHPLPLNFSLSGHPGPPTSPSVPPWAFHWLRSLPAVSCPVSATIPCYLVE